MKRPLQPVNFTTALALSLLSVFYSPVCLAAQPGSPGSLQFKMPPPPSRGTPVGRYRGGASRNNCPNTSLQLTALVPFTEETVTRSTGKDTVTKVWGLTAAQHPTFWFYLPYDSQSGYPVEFALQNEAEHDVYRTEVTLPEKPGVVGISLPATAPSLEVGQSYHWYFKVYCAQKKEGVPTQVDGVVQRVSLDSALANQIEAANPLQRVNLYASHHLWYDTVTTLADLRFAKPADPALTADWTSLLQSIGLQEVAAAPLVACCKPK